MSKYRFVNQPSAMPTTKVSVGTAAGLITGVIVYFAGQFGYEVPQNVAMGFVTAAFALASYFVPEREKVG